MTLIFIKELNNTQAELKKSVAQKNKTKKKKMK